MARTGHKKSPVIGDNGLQLDPGDNTRFLTVSMLIAALPKINLRDPAQVDNRIGEYFRIYAENDMKPTVIGLAMALGMDRSTLTSIKNDRPTGGSGYYTSLPQEVALSIKKAYAVMENLWESYMQNGKINPVSGIFLGKNNYGYTDHAEVVVSNANDSGNDYDAEQIKRLYESNPIDSVTDSDNDSGA